MSQFITIYEPGTAPIKGMASAKVAAMIPPGSGVFSLIQNMRWGDDGVLTVKSGAVQTTFDEGFAVPAMIIVSRERAEMHADGFMKSCLHQTVRHLSNGCSINSSGHQRR